MLPLLTFQYVQQIRYHSLCYMFLEIGYLVHVDCLSAVRLGSLALRPGMAERPVPGGFSRDHGPRAAQSENRSADLWRGFDRLWNPLRLSGRWPSRWAMTPAIRPAQWELRRHWTGVRYGSTTLNHSDRPEGPPDLRAAWQGRGGVEQFVYV